ncbi:MAG: CBS domain-containing protein, partial [Gaiellaceae bacterium]|nr:CBS domain-containing protein [Gaiellaceae bacterium]
DDGHATHQREGRIATVGTVHVDGVGAAGGAHARRKLQAVVRRIPVGYARVVVGTDHDGVELPHVVARGRDPRTTRLGHIAEEPYHVIGPDVPLEEAFRFLEERDAERVPVVDARGRLLGVLSRSVLQRRLAEEAEPADDAEDAPDDLPPAA